MKHQEFYFGVTCGLLTFIFLNKIPNLNLARDVSDSLAGVNGTLAGFALACISIIVGATPTHKTLLELKRIGTLGRLINSCRNAVLCLLAASILASLTRLTEGVSLVYSFSVTVAVTTTGLCFLVSSLNQNLIIFSDLGK